LAATALATILELTLFASRRRRNQPQKNIEQPTPNIEQGAMSGWELDVGS